MSSLAIRKVWKDLTGNKARSVLVIMSITVGVLAIGVISGAGVNLSRDLTDSYLSGTPNSASMESDPFDGALVDSVRSMPEVKEAEGRRTIVVRFKAGDSDWRDLRLTGIGDFNGMRLNKLLPIEGAWPAPDHEILMERKALPLIPGAKLGDKLVIETLDSRRVEVPVSGTVWDRNNPPSKVVGTPLGFVSMETLQWLGATPGYTTMLISVADQPGDKAHIKDVVANVRVRIEESGRTVLSTMVPEPLKHPADPVIKALLVVLGVLGALSLLGGTFLVINTLSAVMAQQIRQIGVMKAIGATTSRIVTMYLMMILGYSFVALLIGIPLGVVGAQRFTNVLSGIMNFDVHGFKVPIPVLFLEIAVGFIVPLLAGLYTVLHGARITVAEAINDFGINSTKVGRSVIDRILGRIHFLSAPLMLSLRNTFRHKGRLVLTLLTLILGGTIFVSVLSLRASMTQTLKDALNYYNYDVIVQFERPYKTDDAQKAIADLPGITHVEGWGSTAVVLKLPDGRDGDLTSLVALPTGSDLVKPIQEQGRWLTDGDQDNIVVNSEFLKQQPALTVGDEITLKIRGHETQWHIVGIVRGVLAGPMVYVSSSYLQELAHQTGLTDRLTIVTDKHDADSQSQMATQIKERLGEAGFQIRSARSVADLTATPVFQFNALTIFLLVMSILLALVGALGLAGTMSINVIERMREIGVVRAIGASGPNVLKLFIVEGLVIAVISWFFGTLLAIPISQVLSRVAGEKLLNAALSYTYSPLGALLWLAVVMWISTVASFLPARKAIRVSVRDVLSYQ